jgi:argininosuccinate lyase
LLCLEHGLDYRSAYRVVGRAVRDGALTAAGLRDAARDLLGRDLDLSPERLAAALDPADAIATRTVTGGAAPAPMDAMLDSAQATTDAARARNAERRTALETAERNLLGQAQVAVG